MLRVLYNILLALFILTLGISFFIIGIIASFSNNLPSIDDLGKYRPLQTTVIYSSDGRVIGMLYRQNRRWVPLAEIPKHVRLALIASEDSRFYEHHGVDFIAVLRALVANLQHKKVVQGGSTITQQLARQLFLTSEVSIERKIKEAILALQIERQYSKDEILEMYLNLVYFGEGAYGIEAAAETYFGKHAKDLTLPEGAMLIGLLPAPSEYNPFVNYKMAKERQEYVLRRMYELGFITKGEYESAIQAKLKFAKRKMEFHTYKYPYFTLYVVHELLQRFNVDTLMRAGVEVHTTLDIPLQTKAQSIVQKVIDENLRWSNAHQSALVVIENGTGRIRTIIGGYKFSQSDQFNRAWQALRQPGSAFKIFVYTAAVLEGYRPDTPVKDEKIEIKLPNGQIYSPRNWDNKYMGEITLQDALRLSRNTVAVRLAMEIGLDKIITLAKAMGITTELKPYPSLALGSSEVKVIDMAKAISVIANDGVYIQPTTIDKIVDQNGQPIYISVPERREVIPQEAANIMKQMLFEVVRNGTGRSVYTPGLRFGGKTGTTNDYRDAWFVGFSPHYSCAVWVGNDDYTPMYKVYGSTLPAEIWREVMTYAERRSLKGHGGKGSDSGR